MAYTLHIEKSEVGSDGERMPISFEDWKNAVSMTEGVRLCEPGSNTVTNPATGAVISIPRREGDTEVYFPNEQTWRAVFHWYKGAADFNSRFDPGDLAHPVWAAAVALASRLGVVIQGDDGERYDLQTGKIVDT